MQKLKSLQSWRRIDGHMKEDEEKIYSEINRNKNDSLLLKNCWSNGSNGQKRLNDNGQGEVKGTAVNSHLSQAWLISCEKFLPSVSILSIHYFRASFSSEMNSVSFHQVINSCVSHFHSFLNLPLSSLAITVFFYSLSQIKLLISGLIWLVSNWVIS